MPYTLNPFTGKLDYYATPIAGPVGASIPGDPGEDGVDGLTIPGASGAPGAAGAAGPAGVSIVGMDGQDGEDGMMIPGPSGPAGPAGAAGDIAVSLLAPLVSETIPSGYSAVVVRQYTIASGTKLTLGSGSRFRIL